MDVTMFRGEYQFLSNFYRCDVTYKGITYHSVEAAYQASKFEGESVRKEISNMTAREAKRFAKGHHPSKTWYEENIRIMIDLLVQKFSNPIFKEKLYATRGMKLIEGNSWHDNFWGHCTCEKCASVPHRNLLGFLLMGIRDEVLPEIDACVDK